MVEASFSIAGPTLKALVSAYKEFAASFVLHFTPSEASVSLIGMDRARSMELHLRPYDYRCDGDFWVRADMNMLSGYASKRKKGETVNVSVRDGKFYVGTIQPGTVIPETEVFDDEKFPSPKLSEDASLSVVVEDFRRVIRSPSASFVHIGFDLDEPRGHLIFSNEQHSILDLGPGELNQWLLNLKGRKRVIYDREAFSTLFIPGLSARADISLTAQDVAIVKYDEDQYNIRFYIAPKTDGAARIAEVLAKPRPVRTEIFVMDEPEIKLLLSTVKAISQANPHGDVSITPLETLNLYWGTQRWQGILRISPSHLERYEIPNPVAGLFYAKDLIILLKDLQTLRLYVEYLPAERKMSLVGVGPRVAPKELVADQTIDGRFVPDVKGTPIFTGPVDLLKRTVEDAEIAEDEFLVFYTTPYEINAFGRNAVYYSATFETDSFKVVEENHVSIIRDRFRTLIGFLGQVPAAEASIGKTQDRPSDVYVACETSLGPLAFTVSQEDYEIQAAESAYKIERERAAAPKVERLPAAPPVEAPIVTLLDPLRAAADEYSSISSGPFRFVLLNDGEIRVSSMGQFLTREELEKRPEILAEAIGHFKGILQTHGFKVPEVPTVPVRPPTPPAPLEIPVLKKDVEDQGREYQALTDQFVRLEAEFFKVEAKPELGAVNALQTSLLGLPSRATELRKAYDNLRKRASNMYTKAAEIPVESERLEAMRELDRIMKAEIDVNVKNIDFYGQRSAYFLNQLTEMKRKLAAPPRPPEPTPPREIPTRPPPTPRLRPEEIEELWQEFIAYAAQQGIPEPLAYRDRFIETIFTAERMEQARDRARRLVAAIQRELRVIVPGPPGAPGVAPGVVPGAAEMEEVYKRLRLPPGTRISDMVFQTVWYQIQRERGLLAPEVLTTEEMDYLWREFSGFLKRFDVEPERFRDAFKEVVVSDMSLADNLNKVMAKAKELTDSGRWGPERWR